MWADRGPKKKGLRSWIGRAALFRTDPGRRRGIGLDVAGRNPYPPACHVRYDHANCRCSVVLGASAALLPGAEPVPPPADQQILLLRNGQTIEGRISQQDGVYVIDLSDGQIRVKPADVDLVCRHLEDGYRRKRAALPTGDAHDHLELAQWCLRHEPAGPCRHRVGRRQGG